MQDKRKAELEASDKKETRGRKKRTPEERDKILDLARQEYSRGNYAKEREDDWLLCEKWRSADEEEKKSIYFELYKKYMQNLEEHIFRNTGDNSLLQDKVRDFLDENFECFIRDYDITKASFLGYAKRRIDYYIKTITDSKKSGNVEVVSFDEEWMQEDKGTTGAFQSVTIGREESDAEFMEQESRLSPEEQRIFKMINDGYEPFEIAYEFGTSEDKMNAILKDLHLKVGTLVE